MPISKYLSIDDNGTEIEVATIDASLGVASSGLVPSLDINGKLDLSFLPSTIGAVTQPAIASEALVTFVNFWNDGGVLKVRNADASAGIGKKCDGYILGAVASGATAAVYLDIGTVVTGLTGLTPGTRYFLSETAPGGLTATPPTASGHLLQELGKAISETSLKYEPSIGVVRA